MKVLVVGGGIAGLCFATAARQRGIGVEVVEISSEVQGFGIVLTGSTLLALDHLGVAEECAQRGWPLPVIKFFDSAGRFVADSPMPRIARANLPVCCAIARPTLASILVASAQKWGAKIRFGVTVAQIEDGSTHAQVRFSDGTCGGYDLVIGADGIYSHIRGLLFGASILPRFAGQGAWRYLTARHKDVEQFSLFSSVRGKTGFVPLNEEWMYVLSTVKDPDRRRVESRAAPLLYRRELEHFGGPLVREMCDRLETADPNNVIWRPFETLMLERWYRGRVVLIGDAAHSVTPHISSGGGMAIEDALTLAAHLWRAAPIEDRLESFCAQRVSRVRQVHDVSLAICREECKDSPSSELIQQLTVRGYNELAKPFIDSAQLSLSIAP